MSKDQGSVHIPDLVGFKLSKVLKLKRRYIDIQMRELGLSRTQWQALLGVKILGPCSQKELLTHLDIDAAHLARLLEELEINEYVVRSRAKEDRRSLLVQLTPHSKQKIIPKIEKALNQENTVLLKGLNTVDRNYLKKCWKNLRKIC
jgi:DNA-binding MarR family transcriptional regulator